MKTSWTDQQLIEDYLASRLTEAEKSAFLHRLECDKTFSDQFKWHKKTMHFVSLYGRQELKMKLEFIHEHLFTDPTHLSFKQRIMQFFHS